MSYGMDLSEMIPKSTAKIFNRDLPTIPMQKTSRQTHIDPQGTVDEVIIQLVTEYQSIIHNTAKQDDADLLTPSRKSLQSC